LTWQATHEGKSIAESIDGKLPNVSTFERMNLYHYFYCWAFNWYNTTKKKDNDTLRVSAIALISGFQTINVLSVFFFIGLLQRRTPIGKWGAVTIITCFLAFNFIYISIRRSDYLRTQFDGLSEIEKKRLKTFLLIYLFTSLLLLFVVFGLNIYVKSVEGNYDIP
jgi:hypothetical protein